MKIKIEGMTCGHCVRAVTTALEKLPGVERVEVDLTSGTAVLAGTPDAAAALAAVREEGYQAQPA